jgi:hypothetical protein
MILSLVPAALALAQPLGAILALWGAWLMLIGARGWWTLGLLVVGGACLLIGG